MKVLGFLAWTVLMTVSTVALHQQVDSTKITESDFNKVVITLQRGECYGPCPIYSVTIHGDGTVMYKGEKDVKVRGKRSYKIPQDEVKKLVEEFYKIDYFSLKDEYIHIENADGSILTASDLPGATTSITISGKTKSIYNYFGGPKSLKELEHKIDETSRSAQYVSSGSGNTTKLKPR